MWHWLAVALHALQDPPFSVPVRLKAAGEPPVRVEPPDVGARYRELGQARDAFVTEDRAGLVWVLYRR